MHHFPEGFLFGSATSAHQVEGSNFNSDWYHWEQIPGNISDGSTSAVAADSWNKWQEDIELLEKTSQNAYRFSIEWAKVEPKEGEFDNEVIEHYRKMLDELKKRNITSMVTLFHFTLPVWFADKGGFEKKSNIKYFIRYASEVVGELGNKVSYWATLNEPNVYAAASYLQGKWCPGKRKPILAWKVWRNLILAHNLAYKKIKSQDRGLQIGCVINVTAFSSDTHSPINRIILKLARLAGHELFIKKITTHSDFLGINHYMKYTLTWKPPFVKHDTAPQSDYGWHVHPEGLYQVAKESAGWQKPIFITENGIADAEDKLRPKFLEESLRYLLKAINEGAPVKGYFHWSLLDNFEWSSGYSMKFGLFTIDRQERKSALLYKDLIKELSQTT